jgi:hypothetical protein
MEEMIGKGSLGTDISREESNLRKFLITWGLRMGNGWSCPRIVSSATFSS